MKLGLMLAAIAANGAIAGGAGAAPRAVSLDTCADQYLLALGDDEQIAAVSPLAEENDSFLRAKAARFPKARPTAEDIIPRRATLALRFWGGAPRMTEGLARAGVEVVTLDYASDFETVIANLRKAAAALEQEARGEAMVADLERRLAALRERPVHETAALYVTPGGVTAAKETMIDSIIEAARAKNAAAEAGLSYWPPLPLEALVRAPPELIIAGFFDGDRQTISPWSVTRHPAMKEALADTPTIHLPADLLACPGWFSVFAAEKIAAGIDALEANHAE